MKTVLHDMEIRQEGLEEGREEGRKLIQLAKKMIRMDLEGISKEEIAKRLEITVEQVIDILK